MDRKCYMSNGEKKIKIVGTDYGVTYVTDNGTVYDFEKGMIQIVRTFRTAGFEIVER